MNRLTLPYPGGFPFEEDDLTFIQNASREVMASMANLNPAGIGAGQGYILHGAGVTLDGSDLNIAEGLIALEGEVLYVPAHTIAITAGAFVVYAFQVEVTWDTTGNKEYQDTVTHDTYEVRRGKLVATTYADIGTFIAGLANTFSVATNANYDIWKQKDIHDVIHGYMTNSDGLGDWNLQTGFVRWWKNSAGFVTVYLSYEMTAPLDLPAAGSVIYNLPAAARPASGKDVQAFWNIVGVGSDLIFCRVASDGNIKLYHQNGSTWQGENGCATFCYPAGV